MIGIFFYIRSSLNRTRKFENSKKSEYIHSVITCSSFSGNHVVHFTGKFDDFYYYVFFKHNYSGSDEGLESSFARTPLHTKYDR